MQAVQHCAFADAGCAAPLLSVRTRAVRRLWRLKGSEFTGSSCSLLRPLHLHNVAEVSKNAPCDKSGTGRARCRIGNTTASIAWGPSSRLAFGLPQSKSHRSNRSKGRNPRRVWSKSPHCRTTTPRKRNPATRHLEGGPWARQTATTPLKASSAYLGTNRRVASKGQQTSC